MPEIGELRRGRDIGKPASSAWRMFVWQACADCGIERWVSMTAGVPKNVVCYPCSVKYHRGAGSSTWRGGRYKIWSGYIMVAIQPDDFFYPMCNGIGHIQEHRLIMAKHLKRCLLPWEVVHHKNGIRDDNRLENLMLLGSQFSHVSDTLLKQYVHKLERRLKILEHRVGLLEVENATLRVTGR